MPKVTISMPQALRITATDRQALKETFQTKLAGVLRRRPTRPEDDQWNVNRVSTEIIVSKGGLRPSKKAGKKAGKKR